MKKKSMNLFLSVFVCATLVACSGNTTKNQTCENEYNNVEQNKTEMKYSKKFTNADFYKDGKFQQEVAIEAMKDMFKFYNVPFTDLMAKEMWVTDFG